MRLLSGRALRRSGTALALAAVVASANVVATAPATAAITSAGCGWQSAMSRANPPAALRAGVLTLPKYAPVSMPLAGDVDWTADPFHDITWQLWFHSLKWMEGLVVSGRPADLALARSIVTDFVHDNPDPGTNSGAWVDHATSLRTSVLVCMWQQSTDAEFRAWITPLVEAHVQVLENRYVGLWNHGLMQNLALLAAGCVLHRDDWRTTAAGRLEAGVDAAVDAQGAMNEQGLGYLPFIQSLMREAATYLPACGLPVPGGIATRIAALDQFAAEATAPGGCFVQVGDTYPVPPGEDMGPYSAWVSTGGAAGMNPPQTTAVYSAGWIFGRDSWLGTGQQYSLRFGPARWVHGHDDHLSMTYWANGRDVLVDAGFSGYADAAYRDWQRSRYAHNVPLVVGARFSSKAGTTLVRQSAAARTHTYSLSDRAFAGAVRRRAVLVDDAMRLMLVRDDVTSGTAHALQLLWHLDPSWRKETVGGSRATFLSPDGQLRATVLQLAAPGTRAAGRTLTAVRGRTSPLQGFVARAHNDRTPDWVVEGRRPGARRQAVVTLVVAAPVGSAVRAVWTRKGIRVTVGGDVRTYTTRAGWLSPR